MLPIKKKKKENPEYSTLTLATLPLKHGSLYVIKTNTIYTVGLIPSFTLEEIQNPSGDFQYHNKIPHITYKPFRYIPGDSVVMYLDELKIIDKYTKKPVYWFQVAYDDWYAYVNSGTLFYDFTIQTTLPFISET